MPNKKKPKKDFPYIQIRINPNEKEGWIKFAKNNKYPSVSEFIRSVVSGYIIRKSTDKKKNTLSKSDELKQTNELIKVLHEERKEYMDKINELLSDLRKTKEITIEYKIKGQILKLLEKHKYNSEEISEIFNLPEPEIIEVLNGLIDQNIIKLNNKMRYEVLSNGNFK